MSKFADYELVAERLPDGRVRVMLYRFDGIRGRLMDATRGDDLQSCIDDLIGRDPKNIEMVGVQDRSGIVHIPEAFIGLAGALDLRYLREPTAIHKITKSLEAAGIKVSEMLATEQTAKLHIDDKWYHIAVKEIPQ